jgi:hypothetical protein
MKLGFIYKEKHNFKIGQALMRSSSVWILACADHINTSFVSGIVGKIINDNEFHLISDGYFSIKEILTDENNNELISGQFYGLSDKIPGAITMICPKIFAPILICQSTYCGTSGHIEIRCPIIMEDKNDN